MPQDPSTLNRKSYAIAGVIVLALALWMVSGAIGEAPPPPSQPPAAQREPMSVQVREQLAEEIARSLTKQGQVEASRVVELKAETAGQVVEVLVEKGARVERGQPLLRLAMNDRKAQLARVEALMEQRGRDYEASRTLTDEGFQSASGLRQLYAAVQEARADREAIRLDIERTVIRAPFDGVLNHRAVELGAYVTPGAPVATLVDLDPLKVSMDVAQQDVGLVRLGQTAEVRLPSDRRLSAEVSYISAAADPGSRTFRVELAVANPDHAVPAGLSAEVRLPVATVEAHFISPATLGLGPDGQIGVKTVDEAQTVHFHPVSVVRTQSDGVWVTGLPKRARIITVGHAYVKSGEPVRPVAEAAPAASATSGR